ncbi:unnamed protein product [Closterium sp. NIES-53]
MLCLLVLRVTATGACHLTQHHSHSSPCTCPGPTSRPLKGPSRCPFLHCPPVSGGSVQLIVRSSTPLVLYELGEYSCPPGCDGHYHHSWGSACVDLHMYTDGLSPGHVHSSARVDLYTLATEPPQTLLWHHRLGHPSLPRLRGMHSRLLVSGLPWSLPPLPPSPAPPCLPCVEGWQRATPHSSSFPPTTAPLQTLHMNVWGLARVSGEGYELYFMLVVDVLIPWIRTVRLQLRERFHAGLPVLRLHSDRGGEFSSDLLREFCRGEGILQTFTLPDSPQRNGIAERHIGLVMEVARTSMIHAAAPHFLWSGLVCSVSTQPLARCLLARDLAHTVLDREGWRCVGVPGQGFSCLCPRYVRGQALRPRHSLTRLAGSFTTPPRAVSSPLRTTRRPPSGAVPGEVAVDSNAARGTVSGGAETGGAKPGGAESGGVEPGGAEPGGAEPEGAGSGGVEPRGAEPGGAESGGAQPQGAASSGGSAGASPRLSPQQLREWLIRRARLWSGATGAGGSGGAGAGGAGVTAGASVPRGPTATGPGGARTQGAGNATTGGVGSPGAVDPTESGAAGAGGTGAGGAEGGGARVGSISA